MSVERVLCESRIRDLEPSKPVYLGPDSTLSEAVEAMRRRGVSCVLVCEDDRLLGIFTERDVLRKIAGQSVPLDQPIKDYMTPDPKTITMDDLLNLAIQLMYRGDYRHVPIVGGSGKVEGVISIQDVVRFLGELFPAEVLNLPPRIHQYMASREGG